MKREVKVYCNVKKSFITVAAAGGATAVVVKEEGGRDRERG